jgi:probable rRNA maturation factor
MTSSGSTLLFGAIPAELKPSASEKRALAQFVELLCRRVAGSRPFVGLLADDAHLQQLNRDFLGHNYPTDVLSFPTNALKPELGEIAISMERASAQASEFGHALLDEVKILLLHGVLHLAGFDHENGDTAMAREENRWRAEFQLPETLIARADRSSRRVATKSRKGAA